MSTHRHIPSIHPAPAAIDACEACGAFNAECLVPDDSDGAMALCWPCAHAHVDHGVELAAAGAHECECMPEAIYPEKVLAARRARCVPTSTTLAS